MTATPSTQNGTAMSYATGNKITEGPTVTNPAGTTKTTGKYTPYQEIPYSAQYSPMVNNFLRQLDDAHARYGQSQARLGQDYAIGRGDMAEEMYRTGRQQEASLGSRNLNTGNQAVNSRDRLSQDYERGIRDIGIGYNRGMSDLWGGYRDQTTDIGIDLMSAYLGQGREGLARALQRAMQTSRQSASQNYAVELMKKIQGLGG